MAWAEVQNQKGETVWRGPDVEILAVETAGGMVKILDVNTSLVIDSHRLSPGDKVVKFEETPRKE